MKATRKQQARADSESRARTEKIADRVTEVEAARQYKLLSAAADPNASPAVMAAAATVETPGEREAIEPPIAPPFVPPVETPVETPAEAGVVVEGPPVDPDVTPPSDVVDATDEVIPSDASVDVDTDLMS